MTEESRFYNLWRQRETMRMNDQALREHAQHRNERPLCHGSVANIGSCRCDCGGRYHGGHLPRFTDVGQDDAS